MLRAHRIIIVSAILPAVAGLAVLANAVMPAQSEGEDEIPDNFGEALPTVASDRAVVARVNGVAIHRDEVESVRIRSEAAGKPMSTREIVDGLINDQLLVQEGIRRGLEPTDEEIEAALAQAREVVPQELVQEVIDHAALYGYEWTVDEYWDLPQHRENYRTSMLAGRALRALQEEGGGPQKVPHGLAIAKLKRDARVERFD